jgi:integrase
MPKNKKRPDGRVKATVYLGTFDGAKQYKYVYGKSQKDVDDKVLQLKFSLRKGLDMSAQRDTFEDWAGQWLTFKKLEVSHNWFETLLTRVDNLQPLFNIPIAKIRTSDIQAIINYCAAVPRETTGRPYSKKTLRDLKIVATAIFKLAAENRVIDYNPAIAVRIPQAAEPEERRALTDEEQQWITDTPHRAQLAAMIMMYSGLRRGELIPLTWSDIDIEQKTITVNKSVEMINGKPRVKYGAKTKAGLRSVDIPQKLVDFLKDEKKTSLLVCPSARGTMMSKSAWRKLWESYLNDLEAKYGDDNENSVISDNTPKTFPRFTAHYLRHTYITLLYFAGVDLLTAKLQVGHADIKMMMDIYTHLDKEFKKKSMQKLDVFLGKKGSIEKDDAGQQAGQKKA